ncbi:MAG: phosphatidate cytidylyltransferase, partial [Candidatus Omnitrophica bacterium]|nr:phosphatidate cytidylyltransferase [Candidatus Omnitrophota bacterium]
FGFGSVVFLCSLVVLADVMAYTIGKLFGKHKLIPQISPNKTIEGSLGGLLGAILGGFIFRYALPNLPLSICLFLGVVIGITSQLGDLVISVIKRDVRVKDSGHAIPGHGGVLDRCDSLIFSIPFMYYLLFVFKLLNYYI